MGASRFATFIMKILIIGDVVAKPGRIAVLERIQDLREQHEIDLAIMNAENLAGGFSVTPSLCEQLFASGIDVMTSGNHIFDKKEAIEYIRKQPKLIRPANYPPNTPGSGSWSGEIRGVKVAVVTLICTPKPLRKKSQWDGIWMAGSRQLLAHTLTSKLLMSEYCQRVRPILPTSE